MARYGQAFRDRAVARLLPPESASAIDVAQEIGVSAQTLERWRSDALSRPARERAWTARARLEAVIATAPIVNGSPIIPTSTRSRSTYLNPDRVQMSGATSRLRINSAWFQGRQLL